MDFKANLKGVKGKVEEKVNSPQKVDFRSVLGKKSPAGSNGNKPTETPSKSSGDLRSVLNKKKTTSPEKNGESEKVNNCVDGGIHDQKTGGGGGGVAPEFVEKLKDVAVLDGQRLRLECRLSSTTAADVTITWTLDGKVIKPSKFIVLANEAALDEALDYIKELEARLQKVDLSTTLFSRYCASDDQIRFYTKFPSDCVFRIFWESIAPSASRLVYWTRAQKLGEEACAEASPARCMPLIDEFLMYSFRVAVGMKEQLIADMFQVSIATVSRVTITWAQKLLWRRHHPSPYSLKRSQPTRTTPL